VLLLDLLPRPGGRELIATVALHSPAWWERSSRH